MSRLQHDLEELRQRCAQLEASLATSGAELQHLREANQRTQEDMKKVRMTWVGVWGGEREEGGRREGGRRKGERRERG